MKIDFYLVLFCLTQLNTNPSLLHTPQLLGNVLHLGQFGISLGLRVLPHILIVRIAIADILEIDDVLVVSKGVADTLAP
jgi:hypothetical protein